MGNCAPCRSLSATLPTCKNKRVRVVHWNGFVEDFEEPITVGEVTGKPPKHFLCTPAELISAGPKPMKPHVTLEPGRIYFLLPYSALQANLSPMDLSALARNLMVKAKASPGRPNGTSPGHSSPARSINPSPTWNSPSRNYTSHPSGGSSPSSGSPGRSPTRLLGADAAVARQLSVGAKSWRPVLDPIRERSFNRRSESDLQEKYS
ncbi:hypothetical protein EUGRSUZ_C00123 [Eucalyptus grandis]|uniref:Uncharacterized protein n=2 Tax=Eucalyptus grandis TaxID=71139 RepID=A0ACC3L951_EUCGR|nr:hypothetical protein EUGRSUZ_C00123 [Eucalyptus grandis]